MDQKELQKRLNQPYTSENWKEIVRYVFSNVSIFATPRDIPVQSKDKDYVESLLHIGNVQLKDGKILDLLELKLKENVNLLKNRVKLNDIVSSTVNMDRSHGVLSIFEKGTEDYRFTFSAKASEFDEEEGDFVIERTDTKRFTYLLGKNESCKTPAERFYALSEQKQNATLKSVEDAFSVEKLSKKFFDDYKKQYEAFVAYLTKTPGYYTAVFSNDDKKIRDFVKIFLGRIVFIKFVQKKGWMGVSADENGWENGDYHFLENAYGNFKHKDNFYSEFLKPLFFDALDKGDRPNNIFELTGTKVPYLSGGLFDNHDPKTRIINFPKEYFESLFQFLDRYNFTIDENDVNDQEVGIDPEMLGHIFENLLEDNKDKGAFYTPKEIVRYMCRESLKEYLKTSLQEQNIWPKNEDEAEILEAGLDDFVNKREAGGIIDFEGSIAHALKTVKICDPAIGSGAFPMGLLQETFHLMHLLYAASPDKVGEIWELDSWKPNVVKQNIIQNSIYGVDIEKGAVDIARLRFWLSLIVDEPEPTALPHLDYKIVVGNSLVSKFDETIIDIDWEAEDPNAGLFGSKLAEERAKLLKKISEKQKQAFDPESDDEKLGHEIRDLKIDLLVKQLEVMIEKQNIPKEPKAVDYQNKSKSKFVQDQKRFVESLGWKKQIQKLKNLKIKPEAPLPYFDWRLDFPEIINPETNHESGFDIVIGNPPYLRVQGIRKADPALANYLAENYKSATGSFDLYVVFTERALKLTKSTGVLNFIMPTKWVNSAFGEGLRTLLLNKKALNKIISFEAYQVFNASTYTGLQWFKNDSKNLEYTQLHQNLVNPKQIDKFLTALRKSHFNIYENSSFTSESITLTDRETQKLLNKLDKFSLKVDDVFKRFFTGLQTSRDSVYFLYDCKEFKNHIVGYSKELKKSVKIELGLVKPLLKGNQVHRYKSLSTNNFVIFPYKFIDNKAVLYSELEIKVNFPLGYDYLKINESILRGRESGRLKDDSYWFKYIYPKNLTLFEIPKLICPDISLGGNYAFDKYGEFYDTTTLYGYIKNENIQEPYEYFLAILNSSTIWYYLKNTGTVLANGYFRFMPRYVGNIPLPNSKDQDVNFLVKVANKIVELKKENKDSYLLEKLVDDVVFKLYQLSYEEALIIDPDLRERKSDKDYNDILKDEDINIGNYIS